MNFVANAWNYQLPVEARRSIKARAVSAIVWLLALMACFTLISRASSSMTVPIVETEKPGRSAISHTVTADGVLETAWDTGVVAVQGGLVREVYVKEGDTVEAGDLLFTYDTKDFNRQISEYQTELKQINTKVEAIQEQKELDEENKELVRDRAQEDLKTIDAESDLDIKTAEEEVRSAAEQVRHTWQALSKYENIRSSDYDDDDYEEGEYTKEEYNQFRSNFFQAQIAYDQAQINLEKVTLAKQKSLQSAQRAIEDADRPADVDISKESYQLDAQLINIKLETLYEAVANSGKVYAPVGGVITGVLVASGKRTTDEAALFINNSETMNFVIEVSKDEKKHVNTGNTVKLRIAGETSDIQGLMVTSVLPSSTVNAYRVTIEMPADYLPGTSGTVEIQQKSKTYDTVVPLSALYAEGTQYYVLKVRESETSMGKECFAERIDVTLQEKNETYAAVTGALSTEDKVISSSNSTIQDEDKVRLQEEV